MVSDLTPEETLRREADEASAFYHATVVVKLGEALAAVAAERERIVKLLRAEAADRMVSDPRGCLIIRDLTDRWIAREGVPR